MEIWQSSWGSCPAQSHKAPSRGTNRVSPGVRCLAPCGQTGGVILLPPCSAFGGIVKWINSLSRDLCTSPDSELFFLIRLLSRWPRSSVGFPPSGLPLPRCFLWPQTHPLPPGFWKAARASSFAHVNGCPFFFVLQNPEEYCGREKHGALGRRGTSLNQSS